MNNLSQKQKDFINQTTNSIGWDLVEQMLINEFITNPVEIDTEGKTDKQIAREVEANSKSAQAAKDFIKKIHQIAQKGDEKNLRNTNYK